MHGGATADVMHVNQPLQLSLAHTYVKRLRTPTHAYEICKHTHTSYTGTHSYIG